MPCARSATVQTARLTGSALPPRGEHAPAEIHHHAMPPLSWPTCQHNGCPARFLSSSQILGTPTAPYGPRP
eukprot:6483660-Amphidinium_carterae.2